MNGFSRAQRHYDTASPDLLDRVRVHLAELTPGDRFKLDPQSCVVFVVTDGRITDDRRVCVSLFDGHMSRLRNNEFVYPESN